jgi:dTDP-D-glucose 4,6-dehydratase
MLVTGGAGFIGSNFVHYTVRNHPEYEVCVLDALTYAGDSTTLSAVAGQVEFVHGDICDTDVVNRLVAKTDLIVHFAAESHVDNSLHDPEPFVRSNIIGTYTLLEAVRRHGGRFQGKIGETYLIGSGDECSNKQIMQLILELMDQPADAYDYVPDRPGHDLRYSNNTTKIRTELGWQPSYGDIRSGLAATIDWYRRNEWWWKPRKEATEARYQVLGR